MDGVQIVLVVMLCSGDLLTCNDMSANRAYRDMSDCMQARRIVLRGHDQALGNRPVRFARCRYQLRDTDYSGTALAAW